MDSKDIQELRLKFFKDKIKSELLKIKDEIGNMRYKLYIATVDACENYEELRDMAELELQISLVEYNKQLKAKLAEYNTDIKDIKNANDINYNETLQLETIDKSVKNLTDITEDIQDEEVSAAMALVIMQRLSSEPIEETYRDELLEGTEKKPELSDLDLISDADFDGDIIEDSISEELDYEEDLFDNELFGEYKDILSDNEDEESIDEDSIEINEDDIFEKSEDNNNDENEYEINENDIFGQDDTLEEINGSYSDKNDIIGQGESEEFDIEESDLFSDDDLENEGDLDNINDIDISEEDIFSEDIDEISDIENDINDIDISEEDIFSEDIDEISDIDIDISVDDIFGDNMDEIDSIEIDETTDDIYGDLEKLQLDDIVEDIIGELDAEEDTPENYDDLFEDIDDQDIIGEMGEESTSTDNYEDLFEDINEDELEDIGNSQDDKDDSDDIFADDLSDILGDEDTEHEFKNTPQKPTVNTNKNIQSGNNNSRRQIAPQTVLNNGTDRGKKAQSMFNWLHKTINKTEQAVKKTEQIVKKASEETQKSVQEKIKEVAKSDFFKLDKEDEDFIDF